MPFVSGVLSDPYFNRITVEPSLFQLSFEYTETPARITVEQKEYQLSFYSINAPEKLTFTQGSYQLSFSPVSQPEKLTFTQANYDIKVNFGYTTVKVPKTIDFRA